MLLDYQNFYLVGIKGVGMTALAQLLVQAGKNVFGSDVAESFPTQEILDHLALPIDIGFTNNLPSSIDCVIYSGANQGSQNPQVVQAQNQNLPIFSHMQALSEIFNSKQGIAICGVGGKSTTSSILAFLTTKLNQPQSYAVGVGKIVGLSDIGHFEKSAPYFIVEADEYAQDPASGRQNFKPRFSFLRPFVTVCTNLAFDHPDVYDNFDHTKQVFLDFFLNIKSNGYLIANHDDEELFNLARQALSQRNDLKLLTFGQNEKADFKIISYEIKTGFCLTKFTYQNKNYEFKLNLPGIFNAYNALSALAVLAILNFDLNQCCQLLGEYQSIKRRFEFLGEKNGVLFYDDYAHHPREIAQAITAIKEWFPERRIVIAFQPHTYSRTKSLFEEFITSFKDADEIILTDIFASAREAKDDTISSDHLVLALQNKYPSKAVTNLHNNENLAQYTKHELHPGDVLITLGAGDIYKYFTKV